MKKCRRKNKHKKVQRNTSDKKMFFNDGAYCCEIYDIENLLAGFETIKMAKRELDHRIDLLEKSNHDDDFEVYEELSSCRRYPCNSAACPVCYRLYRKWFFSEVMQMADAIKGGRIATINFYSEMMTDEQLESFDAKRLNNRLHKQLERCGFKRPVIGCLEFDKHKENGLWLPHYHLLVFDSDTAVKKLRKLFRRPSEKRKKTGAKVDRPILLRKLKDPVDQISYLCKSYSKFISASKIGKRKTRKGRLNPVHERLSLRVKHRLTFSKLLFLHNARRVGTQLSTVLSTTNNAERGKSMANGLVEAKE